MGRYTSGGVGRDILAGAVAGVAAIWVADKLDQAMYRSGAPESRRKSEAARPGGMDPAHVLAKRAGDAIGADLGDPTDNPAGHTIHYGIAAGMGALYGLLRGMAPGVTTGRGLLFGVAMFVIQDEIGNTLMGTAGNPLKYPMRDHARGAAAHSLFGIVTDFGTRLIAPWRDEVVIHQGPPLSERWDRGREYLGQQGDSVVEQGRGLLSQGRDYLGQGINLVAQLAEQARARLPEVDAAEAARRGQRYASQAADRVRAQAPDYDDAARFARAGGKRARGFASDVRSELSHIHPADLARAGGQQAGKWADAARSYVHDLPTPGLARMKKWLFG